MKINRVTLSLLEKDNSKEEVNGMTPYIKRTSGTLDIAKFMEGDDKIKSLFSGPDELIENMLYVIYEQLKKEAGDKVYDSVGIFIKDDEGNFYNNSMDITTLDSIKDFGNEDIDPIYEFFKMTIDNPEVDSAL